jgi:YesN/AraC family two-component response regulator
MLKTLIVEDSTHFRQMLKEILLARFPSMDVKEAKDGSEVLRMVKTFLPHIIFMDIRLPGETGLELTQKIKRDFPQVNIIILTNYDLPEYREAASKFGANHFLSKGVTTRDQISAIIESIIANALINGKNLTKEDIQNGEA